jgi:hypothetical protein
MNADVKDFIDNCPQCILAKKGKSIKPKDKIIITKGPLDRVVAYGWELDDELKSLTGFNWVMDIIDHFSKFLMSIPVENNNGINILCSLKEFINYAGKPKEFQSDNGAEYKNNLIKNFLDDNNKIHIFSSPRHPKSNGVVEVVHKEVRKNILSKINEIVDDVTFKNFIIECVNIHNNNIHTVTGFKQSYLLKNEDEDIYQEVIDNIKNKYKWLEREEDQNYVINIGDHLITKGVPYKLGKTLKNRKTKFKTFKLPLTVVKNFNCGLIKLK